MSTSPVRVEPLAIHVTFPDASRFVVELADGREISIPIVWFPRLAEASQEQKADFRLIGSGVGIHWPQIDEDISVAGLLQGRD